MINITFLHFNIEGYSSSCRYDWLQIDGYSRGCGEVPTPFTIITNTNNVDIIFHSDDIGTRTGFLAIWSATTEPPTTRTRLLSCGQHSAIDCSQCPYDGDAWVSEGWCNGDCSWINEQCVLSSTIVSCGQHYAIDCSLCPYNGDTWVSEGWCNGDCHWVDQDCLPITTRTDIKDDIIIVTNSPPTSQTSTTITTLIPTSLGGLESVLKSKTEETTMAKSEHENIINSSNFPLHYPDNDIQVGSINK